MVYTFCINFRKRKQAPMRISGTRRNILNKNVDENDLGFGTKICTAGGRLIQRDGSFNVERRGLLAWTPYQSLVEMSWPKFLSLVGLAYLLINAFFGLLFYCCGSDGFNGLQAGGESAQFLQLFFFSIQTFTTVGYGSVSPISLEANIIASINAFVGLLAFALATGLLFARFAKPKSHILFSKQALIAPYKDGWSFQFRIVNLRSNNIINLEAIVSMTWVETPDGVTVRRFAPLELERSKVSLFPLNWTLVHPIDAKSPLYEKTAEELQKMNAEFLILISGFDDTFAQQIHDNGSYLAEEVIWEAQFEPMYYSQDGRTVLELDKINAMGKLNI
jgi:inward rectifier potassium channel